MSHVKKRTYTSSIRTEQAAMTRRRILEAAADLFTKNGYPRTTVKEIADRATVTAETVYASFGSKGRVLTALIDQRLTDSADVQNLLELPEAEAIRESRDQREQIAMYARFVAGALERVGPVHAIMRSAAAVDEEISAVYAESKGYRARNARVVVGWIARNGKLRMKRDRAVQLLSVVAGPEVAWMLRSEQGWSEAEYTAWLEDAISIALLPERG
jgi:AcrR family transcriptional regulator